MTFQIFDFPIDWYDEIVTQKFTLRSITQAGARPFGGSSPSITDTQTQIWLCDVTMAPQRDPVLQDMDAFFTRLRGRYRGLRISNGMRLAPWYDRNLSPTTSTFSDGSTFTDGSGFANGFLPPNVFVDTSADRGANYLILGGFPPLIENVIRRGDLLQIKPNGIASGFPHLYKAMFSGSSDANGRLGIEIESRLRAGVASGDQVGLRYASTIFRLATDDQADIEGSGGQIGNFGFSLIEALDLVP